MITLKIKRIKVYIKSTNYNMTFGLGSPKKKKWCQKPAPIVGSNIQE